MKDDSELRRDVEEELEWDPIIDERRIGVAVADGIVTLTGDVRSFSQKWAAERAAERVAGVLGVANEIEVRLTDHRSDADIAKAAVDALTWDAQVPTGQVKVKVEDGRVTLRGEVNYQFERRAAERAVRNLEGVKNVLNLITVKPRVTPKDIKGEIEKAFKRQAEFDAKNISIQASNGEVTLRGRVRSWAERRAAESAAWAAPGVTSVKNLLTVRTD